MLLAAGEESLGIISKTIPSLDRGILFRESVCFHIKKHFGDRYSSEHAQFTITVWKGKMVGHAFGDA